MIAEDAQKRHIIKWKEQPSHRSRSWLPSILLARQEIHDIQEETPSLTRAVLEALWEQSLQQARKHATIEMGQKATLAPLSWEEVFEQEYAFEDLETTGVEDPEVPSR